MNANTRNTPLILAFSALLAACGADQPTPANEEVATDDSAPNTATIANAGKTVELASSTIDQKVTALAPEYSISGQFRVAEEGEIAAFSVLIGNYFNTADGNLAVELCQKGICQTGSNALATSQDNTMFQIKLSKELKVVAGEPVTYKLTKASGKSEVVVWTFAPNDSVQAITGPDGKVTNTAPKLALLYSN